MENSAVTIEIKAEPIEINTKCAEIYRNNLLGTYGCLCFYCGQTLDSTDEDAIFAHLDTHYNFEELVEEEYFEDVYHLDEETAQQPEFVEVKNAKDITTTTTTEAVMKDETSYKCDICSIDFPNNEHFELHSLKHEEENNFEIDDKSCEIKFKTKNELVLHKSIFHNNNYSSEQPKLFGLIVDESCTNFKYDEEEEYEIIEEEHIVSDDDVQQNEKQMFQCNHCKKMYTFKQGLRKHFRSQHPHLIAVHLNPADYSMVTRNENNAKDASMIKDSNEKDKKWFKCNHCEKKFDLKHRLQAHFTKIHSDEHPSLTTYFTEDDYSIVSCNENHAPPTEELWEIDTENIPTNEIEIEYKCNICSKSFPLLKQWYHHIKSHPNENAMLQCTLCDDLFSVYKELRKHAQTNHPSVRFSQGKYKCTICWHKFVQEDGFKKHMESHTMLEYKCDECPKVFNLEKKLIKHKAVHDPSTIKFECDVCKIKFRDKLTLKIHFRRHTGEKPHECSHCKMRFIHRSQMVHHVRRMHTHEKRHQCELCGKGFYGAYYLSEHMKRHTNHKPMKCTYCDEHFYNRRMQLVHERKHTGEKPYVCQECGSAFRTHNRFSEHRQTHSGVKKFDCRFCNVKFATGSGRAKHEKTKHRIL